MYQVPCGAYGRYWPEDAERRERNRKKRETDKIFARVKNFRDPHFFRPAHRAYNNKGRAQGTPPHSAIRHTAQRKAHRTTQGTPHNVRHTAQRKAHRTTSGPPK